MFITYRKINGHEYGCLEESFRQDGKVRKKSHGCLGRVLDKERCIFKNRKLGIYRYDLKTNSSLALPDDFAPSLSKAAGRAGKNGLKELQILHFGDVYLMDRLLEKSGLQPCLEAMGISCSDLLRCMIFYYALENDDNQYAQIWYKGSYARELCPQADPGSERIIRLLEELGHENCRRAFFAAYLKQLPAMPCIMAVCSGLPCARHLPLSAVYNSAGFLSGQVRSIYVADSKTLLPQYVRFVPGRNALPPALKAAAVMLSEQGVVPAYAVLEDDSVSLNDLEYLQTVSLDFIIRFNENPGLSPGVLQEHIESLDTSGIRVEFNQRVFLIKKVLYDYWGHLLYVYLCRDGAVLQAAQDGVSSPGSPFSFMLLSSRDLSEQEILPAYYAGKEMAELFCVSKPGFELQPLLLHSEAVLQGHLLLSFIAALLQRYLRLQLGADSPITAKAALKELQQCYCKVYDKYIEPQALSPAACDILKRCALKLPPLRLERT